MHVNWFGDITASPYAGTVSWQDVTENDDTLVIDQATYFAFKVPDILRVQSKPNVRDGYSKRAVVSMKRYVEQFITSSTIHAAAGNTLDYTTGGAGALTASNVYAMLVQARTLMENDNTWMDGEMWMMVPPKVLEFIRLSTELTHATEAGDKFIKGGAVTKLGGWNLLPISVSNLDGAGSDGDPYKIIGGNRDAIHFAEQINQVESIRLQDSFDTGVRGLMVYGANVFDNNANALITVDVQV